jgi:chemotaxis protein CheD
MTVATESAPTRLVVGIGQLELSDRPEQPLVAIGVGSCIIVCAWDRSRRLGGMAHVVQPRSSHGRASGDARYADQAVPLLLRRMAEQGARTGGLIVKIVGGAAVLFGAPPGGEPLGLQNAQAVEHALSRFGLPVAAREVGGRHGRTVVFDPGTGEVLIRPLGHGEAKL